MASRFATHLLVVVITGMNKQPGVASHIISKINLVYLVNIPNFILGKPVDLEVTDKL